MRFRELRLRGAFLIELEPIEDDRGFFSRSFCAKEFEHHGLDPRVAQCNVSYNLRRGTLRGLHMQSAPHAEAKLVTCLAGAIYDVIIDMRPDSPSLHQWESLELRAGSWRSVYVPEGFAHGFQTLMDDSLVAYQMSNFFVPDAATGVRWDDPTLAIDWPLPEPIMSARDAGYPFIGSEGSS